MAVFDNKLTLDVKGFLGAIKTAVTAADKIPADQTVKLDADAAPLQEALKALDANVPPIEVPVDTSAATEGADEIQGAYAKAAKTAADNVATIETKLKDMVVAGKQATPEYVKLQAELVKAKNAASELAKSVSKIEPPKKLGASLKGAFGSLKGGDIGGVVSGLTSSLGALGPKGMAAAAVIGVVTKTLTSAFSAAKEYDKELKKVKIATGLIGDDLSALEKAAKGAFIKGVGESAADALKQVAALQGIFANAIPIDQLGKAAVQFGKVGEAVGKSTDEIAKGLAPAIKAFGLDAEKALGLFTVAGQKGAADMSALLNTFEKFAPLAKEAGFSAEEFTDALGRAGALGVKDLAQVGGVFKELQTTIGSGALEGELAKFTGSVADSLRATVKAGREGSLSTKEVLQQSITAINEGFAKGEISEQIRAQLLKQFAGSKAAVIGENLFSEIFDAKNVDVAGINKAAKVAGEELQKQLGTTNPFETLQRVGQLILQGIGKPLVRVFERISVMLNKVFGDSADGAETFEKIGEFIGDFIVGGVEVWLDRIEDISEIVSSITGFFSDIGEALGLGATEAEKAAAATNKQAAAAKKAKDSQEKLLADAKGLAKQGKLTSEAVAELAKKYGLSTEEATKLVAASAEIGETVKQAALDVNNLAASFGNAVAAAGNSVTLNRQALAQIELDLVKARKAGDKDAVKQLTDQRKVLIADAKDAVAAQRNLDKTIDRVTTGTDPAAQKKLAADRKQRALEEATLIKRLESERITDVIARTRQQIEIEREAALKSIDIQIAGIDNVTVADRQARALLAKQRIDREKEFDEQLRLVEAQAQQRRFDDVVANEAAILDALSVNAQNLLDETTRQLEGYNLTSDNITAAIEANNEKVRLSYQQTIRGVVESTPQFQRAAEQVQEALSRGLIDGDAAAAQIKDLRAKVEAELLGATGDNPLAALGTRIRDAYDDLAREQAEFARDLNNTVLDQALQKLQAPTLKAVETTVRELEKQRDLLLRNKALTSDQRAEIEASFAGAIDKARKPAARLETLVGNIATSIKAAKFDATGLKEGAEAASKLAEDAARIREEFERGNLTYQEAQARLAALQETGTTAMSVLQDNLATGLRALVDGLNASVQASNDSVATLLAERQQLLDNFVGTNEEKAAQLAQNEQRLVAQQSAALETIAASSAIALADAVLTAEDAGKAIKQVIADQLSALVDVYVAPIIASYLATLGPFALPAALLATTAIKALLNSALAGFSEGGYTGDGGKHDVAGFVHKGEFVSTKETTRKHRAILEHLHTGKDITEFPALQKMLADARIDAARDAAVIAPAQVTVQAMDGRIFASMHAELQDIRAAIVNSDAFTRKAYDIEVHADSGTVIKQMKRAAIRRARA